MAHASPTVNALESSGSRIKSSDGTSRLVNRLTTAIGAQPFQVKNYKDYKKKTKKKTNVKL